MDRPLLGKTALVTGSTGSLGKGIALSLAAAGCHIVLNGFGTEAEIAALETEIRTAHGVEVLYHGADLTRPSEIVAMVARAEERFGAVDILVNNAGVQFVAPVAEFPEEKWNLILALNLSAAFHATQAVLPHMRRRGWGRIVNIASAHGLVASPFKSAYVAAKHGLVGLTKVVALETAREKITCNVVCPGYIETPLVMKQIDEQARSTGIPRERVIDEVILAKHATREFVQVGEVATLVRFLCLDSAASTTGASFPIDGGWTAS